MYAGNEEGSVDVRISVFCYRLHPVSRREACSCINLLTAESCCISAACTSCEQFVSNFDESNMKHGYSTYLPSNEAEYIKYWRYAHGVALMPNDPRMEVVTSSGPHVLPAKLLIR